MTLSEYTIALADIDNRSLALMAIHRGNLACHTPAWKDILTMAYCRAYLERPAVRANIITPVL